MANNALLLKQGSHSFRQLMETSKLKITLTQTSQNKEQSPERENKAAIRFREQQWPIILGLSIYVLIGTASKTDMRVSSASSKGEQSTL